MEHYRSSPEAKYQKQHSNGTYQGTKGQNHLQCNRKYVERKTSGSHVKIHSYTPKDQSKMSENHDSHDNLITLKELKANLEAKIEEYLKNKSEWEVPIPKGTSAYSKAKRAEYVERNLDKAVKFYKISINNNERVESAIKDLATVLHQQGKTEEACKFLEEFRPFYKGEVSKFDNLLNNLKKQITPSGNCNNRTFIIPNVPLTMTEHELKNLFENSTRIVDISFCQRWSEEDVVGLPNLKEGTKLCLLSFVSYSAARKTIETLTDPEAYEFYWMNMAGDIVAKVGAEIIKNGKNSQEKESLKHSSNLSTNGEETSDDSPTTLSTMSKSQTSLKSEIFVQKNGPSTEIPKNNTLPTKFQTQNNNDRVVKRLSFAQEPVSKLMDIAAKKRYSDSLIPPVDNTWNWAVFVDMGGDDSESSDDEIEDFEVKTLKKERAKSLRESIYMNFNLNERPVTPMYPSEMSNGSDWMMGSVQRMKYDVLSEIKMQEERLQKERNEGMNYMRNLVVGRNDLINEIKNRKTSWDPSLLTRSTVRDERMVLNFVQRV